MIKSTGHLFQCQKCGVESAHAVHAAAGRTSKLPGFARAKAPMSFEISPRGPKLSSMSEETRESAQEAGLHEYVDAEFSVANLDSPAREKTLRDALIKLEGLKSLSIAQGKVTAHYEPVLLSEKQIDETIRAAGFQIAEAHVAPSSPMTKCADGRAAVA